MRLSILFIGLSFAAQLIAEEPTPNLGQRDQDQALEWLLSDDSDIRRKAHQALSQLGDRNQAIHEELLLKARETHFQTLLKRAEQTHTSTKEFTRIHREWARQASETLEQANRPLAGKHPALKKLAESQREAQRLHRGLSQMITATERRVLQVDPLAKIILELDLEVALLRGNEEAAAALTLDKVIASAPYGDHLLAAKATLIRLKEAQEQDRATQKHNDRSARWPNGPQREFARLLNQTRNTLGLSPLYLQRELCRASFNHSEEMRRLNYFDHTSPTPANASAPQRAKNARYGGRWIGENIFMGKKTVQAAYDAWWKSDGHRIIMLLTQPNQLGIGFSNRYWTLNMGRGDPPLD